MSMIKQPNQIGFVGDRPQKKPKAVQRMKKVRSTPSDGIRTVNETEQNDLISQHKGLFLVCSTLGSMNRYTR